MEWGLEKKKGVDWYCGRWIGEDSGVVCTDYIIYAYENIE